MSASEVGLQVRYEFW